MALTEMTNSYTYDVTRHGETVTRVFRGEWAYIDAGTDGVITLPVIGSRLSDQKRHITCTHIHTVPVPNNNDLAECTVTYSSGGMRWPEYEPETVASVKQVFDFQMSPSLSDAYYDYGTSQMESWKEICAAASIDPVPPRVPERPFVVMHITGHTNSWDWHDINDCLGKINSTKFLTRWSERWVVDAEGGFSRVERLHVRPGYTDIGKWLFAGFRAEMVGRDMGPGNYPHYMIDSTFMYEPNGWNTPYTGLSGYTAYDSENFDKIPRPQQHRTMTHGSVRT